MPINLEMKARIPGVEGAVRAAQSLGACFSGELHQTDTYFRVGHGRLKLREMSPPVRAELIAYTRQETAQEERLSHFQVYPVQDPVQVKQLLGDTLGISAVVDKKRMVYMHGQTRIHIDTVSGLGCFLEFECPILESHREEAVSTLRSLLSHFGVVEEDIIMGSYSDLLLEVQTPEGERVDGL
jgi:predicted adenylyl cyclase CyaB